MDQVSRNRFAFKVLACVACLCAALLFGSVAYADIPNSDQQVSVTDQAQQGSAEVQKPAKAGWNKSPDGNWYYYANVNAAPTTGWLKSGGKWYYLAPEQGGALQTGKFKVGTIFYIADSNGAMHANRWLRLSTGWYFATSSGALKTGWLKSGGKWYYLDPANEGLMKTGIYTDGKATYASNSSGAMYANRWIQDGKDWYYASGSGAFKSGWQKSGGKWYYLQPKTGLMASNKWVNDGKANYYLTGSGAMATGWLQLEKDWYYLNKSGARVSGWQKSGGKWYYLQGDNNGIMIAAQTKSIANALYAFDANGAMRANCAIDLDDNGYGYAASSGAITRIGMREDGKVILKDAKGNILTGWQKLAGEWFYGEDKTGIMHTGWLDDGGKRYYLDASGAMATGTRTIDGKAYAFSSSGALVQITGNATLDNRLVNLAKSQGSLRNCYNWVKNHKHTNWAAGGGVLRYANGTYATTTGWVATEAARMLDGKTTDCYAFAATFACLAKALGYDAKVVNGYVPSRSKGWASHSWVEIKQGGTTYVYDPDLGRSISGVNFYGFTYGAAPTNYKR